MFDGHEHGTLEPHMPLYEYRCEEDGNVITLLRPMAQADEPVERSRRARPRVHAHPQYLRGESCGRTGIEHQWLVQRKRRVLLSSPLSRAGDVVQLVIVTCRNRHRGRDRNTAGSGARNEKQQPGKPGCCLGHQMSRAGFALSDERQNRLRLGVGERQGGRRGLSHDLLSRQGCGFRSKVGITDG
jgi:hypothetical protein